MVHLIRENFKQPTGMSIGSGGSLIIGLVRPSQIASLTVECPPIKGKFFLHCWNKQVCQ